MRFSARTSGRFALECVRRHDEYTEYSERRNKSRTAFWLPFICFFCRWVWARPVEAVFKVGDTCAAIVLIERFVVRVKALGE